MRPITSLIKFKRGDHICIFYRDENSLTQTLAHYIAAGLQNGERCFCAQKQQMIPRILNSLEALGVNTAREVERGALELHTEDEVYFTNGRFEPQVMMEMLEQSIVDAVACGFTGFRTAGELSWAMDRNQGDTAALCDQIVRYETMVERSYPGKPAIGVCQYPAHRFPREVVQRVLESHRMAIEETMVSVNHSTLTLRSGDFLADIVTDRVNPGEAFHYVVQKQGSPEVLSWGQEPSMDGAIRLAENIMKDLGEKYRQSRA